MRVEFNTTQFQFSHGKMPRGVGQWAFEIKGQVVFAPGSQSFASAKKWATEQAKAAGTSFVKVCS
jgi:hypothetical protein